MEQNDQLFRRIDLMVDKIHQHTAEPHFSEDLARRRDTKPNFKWPDDYILKRMIELIAFSQQVQSSRIVEMIESGVFVRVFPSFSPSDVAKLYPSELKKLYWNNPSKPREERLSPLRFPSKLEKMVKCAESLIKIASRHGSFMRYLESQRFPIRIMSKQDVNVFWEAFDNTLQYFGSDNVNLPFFKNFTSLCHLLQVLGFDCAKPDSIVMDTASRLCIVPAQERPHSKTDRKKVILKMQLYSLYKSIRTPVVDLYFLIDGGQTDARKFVKPSYYQTSPDPQQPSREIHCRKNHRKLKTEN